MSLLEFISYKEEEKKPTKTELNFNKLMADQDLLQNELNTIESYVNQLNTFNNEINNLYDPQINLIEKENINLLLEIYLDPMVKKKISQKNNLRDVIISFLEPFQTKDYSFYKTIFEQLMTSKDRERLEKEQLKFEKEIKDKLGFDFTMDEFINFDIHAEDITEEKRQQFKDISDYFYQKMYDNFDEEYDTEYNEPSKKTAKKETKTDINITKIFKEIALKIHPDREKNDELRLIKESLMKRLTVARNTKNLYEMFKIAFEAKKHNFLSSIQTILDSKTLQDFSKLIKKNNQEIESNIDRLKYEYYSITSQQLQLKSLQEKKIEKIKSQLKKKKTIELENIKELNQFFLENSNDINLIIRTLYLYY